MVNTTTQGVMLQATAIPKIKSKYHAQFLVLCSLYHSLHCASFETGHYDKLFYSLLFYNVQNKPGSIPCVIYRTYRLSAHPDMKKPEVANNEPNATTKRGPYSLVSSPDRTPTRQCTCVHVQVKF